MISFYAVCVSLAPFYLYASASHRSLHSSPTRRSSDLDSSEANHATALETCSGSIHALPMGLSPANALSASKRRSEEHTSELQSRGHLVCRLLLEKKNI